jgi:hypothetical protein
MRSRLTRCNCNPRRTLNRKRARLTASRVLGQLCGNAHDLEGEQWCNTFACDPIALPNRLVSKQHDRSRSIVGVVTEWRLLLFGALAVAMTLRIWRTRNCGEGDALSIGTVPP